MLRLIPLGIPRFIVILMAVCFFYSGPGTAFDPQAANETLNKLSIKLSTQNLVAADLDEAAATLLILNQEAQDCVETKTLEIEKYDRALPKQVPNQEITYTPDQQFVLQKKTQAELVLSECRLFILRSDEARKAYLLTAQTLKTKYIFSRQAPLFSSITDIVYQAGLAWQSSNISVLSQRLGLSGENKLYGLFIVAMCALGLFLGAWCRSLLKQQCQVLSMDSQVDKRFLNMVLTLKHHVAPLMTCLFGFITASLFGLFYDEPRLLSMVLLGGLLFVLAHAATRFCFSPPSPALPFCNISSSIGERLTSRLVMIYGISLFSFLGYKLFYLPNVAPEFFDLMAGILVSIAALLLFQILFTIMIAPKFLSQYKLLRNVFAGFLLVVLAVILIAEWSGYQAFARYLLFGSFATMGSLFVLWLCYVAFVSVLTSFVERRYHWQKTIFQYLDLADDVTPIEITALRLFAFLLFFSLIGLCLNEIWSLSDAWSHQLKQSFIEGFTVAESKVVPLRIIISLLFLSVGLFLSRAIKSFMVEQAKQTSQSVHDAHIMIMNYVLFTVVTIFTLIIAGVNLQGLALIAGALSVGIGFGLQGIVNNFVSGLILLFERPIKRGDRIIVGDKEGFVSKIGVRSTRVNTIDKSDVIVPNAELINSQVTNFMYHNKRWLIVIPIGVEYGSDIELVRQLLLDIASQHEEIIQTGHEAPSVFFMTFGDNALLFELWVVVKNVNHKFHVTTDLNFAIDKSFKQNNITIAFPQTDLHIKGQVPLQLDYKPPTAE